MKFKFSNAQFGAMSVLLVSANLFLAINNTANAKSMASGGGTEKFVIMQCCDANGNHIATGNSCTTGVNKCVVNDCPM